MIVRPVAGFLPFVDAASRRTVPCARRHTFTNSPARRAKLWFGAATASIMQSLSTDDETDMQKEINGR